MREAHAYQCGCGAWHIGHPRYLRPTGPERTSR
jgi:GH24 family phage-related lysozyme (muramidase)